MPISEVDIVMVAERTVQQGLLDLRGELGATFQTIDSGLQGLQSIHYKLTEMEENFENLNDNVTAAFKNNNALLRNEIKAMAGDIAQKQKDENAAAIEQATKTQTESMKKQIDELEKNINITLENIKQNNINVGGNRDRNETMDNNWDPKGNKYGFNKDWKLEVAEKWSDNNSIGFNAWKLKA